MDGAGRAVRWVGASLLALAALTACSDDDPVTGAPTTAEADADARIEEQRERYREAVGPLNEQLAALSQAPPDADLATAQAALRAYGAAAATAARHLEGPAWDGDLEAPVDELVAALEEQAALFEELAGSADLASLQAASERSGASILRARTAAAAVEQALGIDDGLLGPAADRPVTSSTPTTTNP